jgi:hypothetical protein
VLRRGTGGQVFGVIYIQSEFAEDIGFPGFQKEKKASPDLKKTKETKTQNPGSVMFPRVSSFEWDEKW